MDIRVLNDAMVSSVSALGLRLTLKPDSLLTGLIGCGSDERCGGKGARVSIVDNLTPEFAKQVCISGRSYSRISPRDDQA
jgi:hypothetical protein